MYTLWDNRVKLPKISELKALHPEIVTVKAFEPEKDGYVFLHGLAIAEFHGRMYCTWAHNRERENSNAEEVNFAVSDDLGKTWSPCMTGNLSPEKGVAVSHGAFLLHEEKLWFFAPLYKGQLCAEMLTMGLWCLDEEKTAFRFVKTVLNERFWPMCEPVLLDNGSYIMAGIYVADGYYSPDNTAAVAISRGGDILHWDMVRLDKAEDVQVWGECSVIAEGNRCRMYCRKHAQPYKALYAESCDFGESWSTLDLSDLPMIDSKPYAGKLTNGRNYLICSCAEDVVSRNPLTIALTAPGEEKFSEICRIETGNVLSYPYAIEHAGKLYVVYSSSLEFNNQNNAKLAIIDLEELK